MTDYEVHVGPCQEVVRTTRETMTARDTHFGKIAGVVEDTLSALNPSYVVQAAYTQATHSQDAEAVDSFFADVITPEYNTICDDIESCINAFNEAVNYYISGDAEVHARGIAEEATVTEVSYPSVYASDGSTLHEGGTIDGPASERQDGAQAGEIGAFENQEQYPGGTS